MAIEIKAPAFPESVADGEIAAWHKNAGDSVSRDELLVEIETDKVVLEVVAPVDGVLIEVLKEAGDVVLSEEPIARIEEGAAASAASSAEPAAAATSPEPAVPAAAEHDDGDVQLGPAARRLAEENNIDISQVTGTGKDGRITKEDLLQHLKAPPAAPAAAAAPVTSTATGGLPDATGPSGERIEKRVPMTRMRKRIADRLLGASQDTAMLTTFNEVNMAPVMALRSKYKEQFAQTHNGTRLGFMGFFVKATCEALKRFPEVNASIDGDEIIYDLDPLSSSKGCSFG